ncbi:hypothetical protein L0664_13765 [Octadecabacter sp. G9-8]|uniref:Uncharacterized protein n=1 Tax=Octadecabacter dasysiphoniae TaxID=2909341 RepID=A0ABS9CY19_9RHOB|nr:hypothetical protein [Octadecabacter dasysiphoniae]MCF2872138.1 hypothetical protein [Octadecabacter dasysiphoniae]
MTLRNRVQPDGQILAVQSRGMFTGNRGILHTSDKIMGDALWKHRAWICCTLTWQNRRRPVMTGRNWTELFFLDEAVAMAAGHRPCAYCRRVNYIEFSEAWGTKLKAPQMDQVLHAARAINGARKLQTHHANADALPPGTFIKADDIMLVTQDAALPAIPQGYGAPVPRPTGIVTVLTCVPMLDVLRGGYVPAIHPSAQTPLFT